MMNLTIKIPRQDKEQLIGEVQEYLQRELGEHVGNILAEGLLDHVLSLAGPYAYNQAIRDVKDLVSTEWARLDEEMSVLERPVTHRR